MYDVPFKLNIGGIRSADMTPNVFNDLLYCFYRDEGVWKFHVWDGTTDPGLYWMKNPSRVEGVAVLVPKQYQDVYALDYHAGKYLALCQRLGEVDVYRDLNRDTSLDLLDDKIYTGFFGINLHRASLLRLILRVGKWSAGCQVFQSSSDFSFLIDLCKKHKVLYENAFTYTLLVERDFLELESYQKELVLLKSKEHTPSFGWRSLVPSFNHLRN